MKGIHRFSKKEKTVFWAAASTGIAGGVIGNLFASAVWQSTILLLGNKWWSSGIMVILTGLAFLYLIFFIRKQIETNRPVKRRKRKQRR